MAAYFKDSEFITINIVTVRISLDKWYLACCKPLYHRTVFIIVMIRRITILNIFGKK